MYSRDRSLSTKSRKEIAKFINSWSNYLKGKNVDAQDALRATQMITADYVLAALTIALRERIKETFGIRRRRLPIVDKSGFALSAVTKGTKYEPSELAVFGRLDKFEIETDSNTGAAKVMSFTLVFNNYLYIDDIGSEYITYVPGKRGNWYVSVNGVKTEGAHPIRLGYGSHKPTRDALKAEYEALKANRQGIAGVGGIKRFFQLQRMENRKATTRPNHNNPHFTTWVERVKTSKTSSFNYELRRLDKFVEDRNNNRYIRAVTYQEEAISKM